jgi:glycosyltransferase involved in cell wall biosynthesis
MNPFFSVIIPLYNKEKYIRKTLSSIFAQRFCDYEIIVINDGSKDNGGNIVKELADHRIRYYETENKGVSSARNLGISLATGKFIAFLDADDYWYPHFLEEIHQYICRFPELKVFATAIEFEYKGKVAEAEYSIQRSSEHEVVNYFEASYKRTAICSSSAAFERSIFKSTGVFDTTITRGEDTDLWVRIGLQYKILFIWKVGVIYSYDPNSLSRNGKNIRESASFSKYTKFEANNKALKKFLDLNRFSLAIKSKLCGDKESFAYFKNNIDKESLSSKKRLLLFLPSPLLRILIYVKHILMKLGIGKSVFVR